MSFQRGEVVWLSFTPQKGHEQSGHRPAVVISPFEYNSAASCAIVCPITSNTSPWPWKVMLAASSGLEGSILVDQVKSLDLLARGVESSGTVLDNATIDEVIAKLKTIVG